MSVRQLVKDNPDPVALLEINELTLELELASCAALQHMYSELALDAEDRSKLFLPVLFSRRKIGRHGQELKPPRIQLG